MTDHTHTHTHSRQDVLMTATSFHSISPPQLHAAQRSAGSRKCHNARKYMPQSYSGFCTGLPLLPHRASCVMPKITDLMAYLFPSG